ncbi:TPA: hypothetical protein ACG1QB_004205 [Enterobacter asburiae]
MTDITTENDFNYIRGVFILLKERLTTSVHARALLTPVVTEMLECIQSSLAKKTLPCPLDVEDLIEALVRITKERQHVEGIPEIDQQIRRLSEVTNFLWLLTECPVREVERPSFIARCRAARGMFAAFIVVVLFVFFVAHLMPDVFFKSSVYMTATAFFMIAACVPDRGQGELWLMFLSGVTIFTAASLCLFFHDGFLIYTW